MFQWAHEFLEHHNNPGAWAEKIRATLMETHDGKSEQDT